MSSGWPMAFEGHGPAELCHPIRLQNPRLRIEASQTARFRPSAAQ
jgi:hypothetical protein